MSNLTILEDFLKLCVSNCAPLVKEPVEYALFPAGKRIRPIFAMEICEMLGGDIKEVLPYAATIELIHAYSLVHDDLPAMDNADTRRGKPSLHKAFGQDIAILAGDALLNLAYETMLTHGNNLRIMQEIAHYAGGFGIISGQIMDISAQKPKNQAEILKLYELKTASLFKAAFYAGAAAANATSKTLAEMLEIGKNLGIYFQIQDDLLDDDIFIQFLGQDNAQKLLQMLCEQLIVNLKRYENHENVLELVGDLNNRKF